MSVSTFCFSSLVQIDSRCVRQLLVSGSLCTAGRLLSIHWGTSRPKRNVRELQKSLKTHMVFWLFLMLQMSFHFRCHNVELEEALARFCFPSSRRPTEHWSKSLTTGMKANIKQLCFHLIWPYSSAWQRSSLRICIEKLSSTTPPSITLFRLPEPERLKEFDYKLLLVTVVITGRRA